MLPAISRPIDALIKQGPLGRSISLTKMGCLYIAAAFCQCTWPFLLWLYWDTTKQFLALGFLSWTFVAIWIAMLWLIPHLTFIGFRLIQISRDTRVRIHQTKAEKEKMRLIALILVLGIILDLLLLPFMLFQVEDKGVVVVLSVLLGGRVLKVNLEAVLQYHRM